MWAALVETFDLLRSARPALLVRLLGLALLAHGYAPAALAREPENKPRAATSASDPVFAPAPEGALVLAPAPEGALVLARPPEGALVLAPAPEGALRQGTKPTRTCRLCGRMAPELDITIPVWLPIVVGTFGYGDVETGSDLGKRFSLDSSMRFAYMGRLGVRAWGVGIAADGYGLAMTTNASFNLGENGFDVGSVDVSASIVRLVASYRLPQISLGHRKEPILIGFVPYAGTRFHRLAVGSTHSDGRIDEHVYPWWNAIVGTALEIDFRMGLSLHAEFDAGGFDLDHNMGWWVAVALQYTFTDWLGLSAGWNFYRLQHEIALGENAVDLRLRFNGPLIGLSFYIH